MNSSKSGGTLKRLISGRMNRKNFILGNLALVIAFVGTVVMCEYIAENMYLRPATVERLEVYISFAVALADFVLFARRLHDLDKDDKWLILPGVLCILEYVPIIDDDSFLALVYGVVYWGLVIYLCVAKGTPGPNQYGNADGAVAQAPDTGNDGKQ